MPRGDGTGPAGLGPMTGRAAGFCAGFGLPGYANPMPGRGLGFGRGARRGGGFGAGFGGGGRGWRNRFYATGLPGWARLGGYPAPQAEPNPEAYRQALASHAEALRSELEAIEARLSELEAGAAE